MIDFINNFLFIHIPKTGGTSIENFLHPNSEAYSQSIEKHRAEHVLYCNYEKNILEKGLNINDFYVFSFVRNPYSRIYSHWKFLNSAYRQYHDVHYKAVVDFELTRYLFDFNSFIGFIYDVQKSFDRNNPMSRDAYLWYIFSTQCEWLGDIKNIDFIGRFEKLEKDFANVFKKLYKKKMSCTLPKLNRTTEFYFEYLDKYDIVSREKVCKMFISDIETFKYRFSDKLLL
jgi:hypothetical protein